MRILLLGGTGAMGANIVNLLKGSNNSVVVTSRRAYPADDNITYVKGDAKDINFLNQLLSQNWDTIIDFMVYDTQSFKGRLDLLLRSTSQYIFLSSSRVYADSDTPITEKSDRLLDVINDDIYLSSDEYALSKAREENLLQKSQYKNWTIIRPYITYSPNRLQLGVLEKEGWLYRVLQGKPIVFSKDILSKTTTMTNGYDVARGIISIIGKKEALSEIFHITTNNDISQEKILDIYLNVLERHLGTRPTVKLVDLNSFISLGLANYQIKYDRLYNRKFNNDKINKFISVDSFESAEIGLERCLLEFLKAPEFLNINKVIEAKKNIIAGNYSIGDVACICGNKLRCFRNKITKFIK